MKPVSDDIWIAAVAEALLDLLPRSVSNPTEIDAGTTPSFHYACRLLERLGYLAQTDGMVTVMDAPTSDIIKTRWDDAYHILLQCFEDCGLIQYTPMPHGMIVAMAESYGALAEDVGPEIDTSGFVAIEANRHTSNALAAPKIVPTLETLGLIKDGCWTGPAIPVLWRKWANQNPNERPGDTEFFQDRIEAHFAAMPNDIGRKLDDALTFSEALLDRKRDMIGGQADETEVKRLAGQARMLDIEFLLSERWRFSEGWLSTSRAEECLFFGFDPLAAEMAHNLVTQKYADTDVGQSLVGVTIAKPPTN